VIFHKTKLKDVFLVEPEKQRDDRGFFCRTWCVNELGDAGLSAEIVQCSVSYNDRQGTLRGMHYQLQPLAETKLVRCTAGAIFDVAIDLRPDSATYLQWQGFELTQENHLLLYIPEGFAHGFETLRASTEVFYQMSQFYSAAYARGLRWNDPAFSITWPLPVTVISVRDQSYPDFIP
jgi:dTDP-4-dehydrorhamnose 3,5-epimerase